MDEKIKENKAELRKGAMLAEKLRAAEMRRMKTVRFANEMVSPSKRTKVTIASKGSQLIRTPPSTPGIVRRIPLSEVTYTVSYSIPK